MRGWCCVAVAAGRQQSSHTPTQGGEHTHTHKSGYFVVLAERVCRVSALFFVRDGDAAV